MNKTYHSFSIAAVLLALIAPCTARAALTVTNTGGFIDSSFPATNTVDGLQSTFVNMNNFSSAGSYITYDLGSVQPLSSIAFSSRDSGFFATDSSVFPGAQGNFAAIQIQASDNPNASSGWTTIASNSFNINVSSASGRLLLPSTVTDRFFRFLELGPTTKAVQFAEMRANPRVVIIGASATGINDPLFPIAQGADGDLHTVANLNALSGSLTLDLGEFGLAGITNLNLIARDVTANFMPSNVVLKVSSTDNPNNFDTVLATANLSLATVSAGGTNHIAFSEIDKRYVELLWNGNVSGSGPSVQIGEIDFNSVPEPAAVGLMFAAGWVLAAMGKRRLRI